MNKKTLLVALLAILTASSCKKQTITTTGSADAQQESAQKTEQQIQDFLSNYIHKKTRSESAAMHYTDAGQAIENAMNYEYARIRLGDNWYNESHHYTITENSTSDTLSATMINSIYSQIIAKLKATDLTYGNQEHQLTIVDVKITTENGIVKIDVDDMFALVVPVAAPVQSGNWTFDYPTGQGWHWAEKGGFFTAPLASGQFVGTWGAPEKLTQYAQHNCWWNYAQNVGYYTNITTVNNLLLQALPASVVNFILLSGQQANPYHTALPAYISNHAFYHDNSKNTLIPDVNGFHVYAAECIPHWAMNFYIGKLVQLFTNILPQSGMIPAGKSIYNFEVRSEFSLATGPYDTWHDLNFKYGNYVKGAANAPQKLNY